MPNPWLSVPLSDYEGHMGPAGVQQLAALSGLFAEAVEICRPESVAILGIAGGNGLEHIDRSFTRRIVGVDINPQYLDSVRRRFGAVYDLELHCRDLAGACPAMEPVQLVHAALIFEHAGACQCLENAIACVAPGGALSVVLQLPSEFEPGVSASPFPSIQKLKSDFALIDPLWFRESVEKRGFRLKHESRRALAAGKGLWMGVFHRQ